MATHGAGRIIDLTQVRGKKNVFPDRINAGRVLADMLGNYARTDSIVMAVPAGGVPVGAELARELQLPLDVVVVSKITPPMNTEVGYGAVAFDGSVELNRELLPALALSEATIKRGIDQTREKVERRQEMFRGSRPMPDVTGKTVIIVDDGLASGFTIQVAVDSMKNLEANTVIVAVPTAHKPQAMRVAKMVSALYCPNVRSGFSFAVADAYHHWRDIDETEAKKILDQFRRS